MAPLSRSFSSVEPQRVPSPHPRPCGIRRGLQILASGLLDGRVWHRINSGGDHQGNSPIYPIFVTLNYDHRTKVYMLLRTGVGLSKSQIIHCLKRYVAREVFSGIKNSAEIVRCAVDIYRSIAQTEPPSRGRP